MRISTPLDYSANLNASVALAQQFESAGIDQIWIAEAYGFDAVSLIGFLAARTRSVGLGTGVLNVFSRSASAIAQTAAGLDALSEGRFTLGLGTSGPQVIEGFHGIAYDRPLTRLQEVVAVCRMAWRREPLQLHGSTIEVPLKRGNVDEVRPLKLINRPIRSAIPLYLAALGPKSVEFCAAAADGWFPFPFIAEQANTVWGDALLRGGSQRLAELGPLDIVAGGPLFIGSQRDAAEARQTYRAKLALYIGGMGTAETNFYNKVF